MSHISFIALAVLTIGRVSAQEVAASASEPSLDRVPVEALPELFYEYATNGAYAEAQAVVSAFTRAAEPRIAALFHDITRVATAAERTVYENLPLEARPAYELRFWQKRDPTPATRMNERLIEHYRRVFHALDHYGAARRPWDRRGDVFVRYGDPAHTSRSHDVRFETDPDVVRVKDALTRSLSPHARQELDTTFGIRAMGGGRSYGRSSGSETILRSLQTVRGYPLFPVRRGAWEYWIYPELAGGSEFVFEAIHKDGDFDFPGPPLDDRPGGAGATYWSARQPEHVLSATVQETGDQFELPTEALSLFVDHADFIHANGVSRLEIYLGLASGSAEVERGIALFDTTWTALLRRTEDLTHDAPDFLTDQVVVNIVPGRYHLGVQVSDGGRLGVHKAAIEVEPYGRDALAISDIVFARRIASSDKGTRPVYEPNPTRAYPASALVFFEVYGLKPDAFGQTRYTITCDISPREGSAGPVRVLRSLGRLMGVVQEEQVRISIEQTGEGAVQYEYFEIDVSAWREGWNDMVIEVRDEVAGAEVEKSSYFWKGKNR